MLEGLSGPPLAVNVDIQMKIHKHSHIAVVTPSNETKLMFIEAPPTHKQILEEILQVFFSYDHQWWRARDIWRSWALWYGLCFKLSRIFGSFMWKYFQFRCKRDIVLMPLELHRKLWTTNAFLPTKIHAMSRRLSQSGSLSHTQLNAGFDHLVY